MLHSASSLSTLRAFLTPLVTRHTPPLCCLLAVTVVVWLLVEACAGRRRRRRLPPGPWGWPLLGYLPRLGPDPHLTLTALADVHGDVYSVRLGLRVAVIVNGWRAVRQALVVQSDDFASRPRFASFGHYADGKSLSFQPYTTTYRVHRHVVAGVIRAALRGGGEGAGDMAAGFSVERLVAREADRLVGAWVARPTPFDPAADLTLAVGGILYSLCFGAELDIRDDVDYASLVSGVNPSTQLFGVAAHRDLLPWPLAALWRRRQHRDNSARMARFVRLNGAKQHEHERTHDAHVPARDVLDLLIRAARRTHHDAAHAHLLSTTIEFLSAGTDTSSTTLLWLVLYMACHPAAQARAHAELAGCPPGPVAPRCAPFTEACVFEVMRLVAIVPFALPHAATRDVTLDGYDVPRDTLVLVNLWSVGHDRRLWRDPERFRPERFLRSDAGRVRVDRQRVHRFLPFGAGRRRCVGERLGQMQVFLLFTALLRRCLIRVPPGEDAPSLAPLFGDVMKPRPYKVLVTER